MADSHDVYVTGHGFVRQVVLHRAKNSRIHYLESNRTSITFMSVITQVDEETR
jgi:hypothetical protein